MAEEPLTRALDDPALTWTAGGDVPWKAVEAADAHAGNSVAELWIDTGPDSVYGPWVESSLSWLETTATGPGMFALWLRHNNNPYVELTFSVDGVTAASAWFFDWPEEEEIFSGWYRVTAFLPSGPHRVRLEHRFHNDMGTIPISNPKVQVDDAKVLPAVTPNFLANLELPAEAVWYTGGGGEFHPQAGADSHDGVDSVVSDDTPAGWDSWNLGAPWLKREVTGPLTLSWWQRQRSLPGAPGDGPWERKHLFVPSGNRSVTWSGWRLALDEFSEEPSGEISLAEALESGDRDFTSSGGLWKGERTAAAPDGEDAAWTLIPAKGSSSLETVIDGPASLHFAYNRQIIPAIEAEAAGESLTCTLDGALLYPADGEVTTPIPAGRHVVRWTITNPAPKEKAALMLLDRITVTPAAAVALSEALDSAELPWTTGGTSPAWTGMAISTAPDGQDAAVPPVLAPGETSWLETSVTGPGRLTFLWSGVEAWPYDWSASQYGLSLSVDGQPAVLQRNSQTQPVLELGPGPHKIRWTSTGLPQRHPLLLDHVQWTPALPDAVTPFLAAVENPALQLFTGQAGLISVEPSDHFEGGTSLRLTGPAPGTEVSLTAVALQPGYLTYYYKKSDSARFDPAGSWSAVDQWSWQILLLEPGALTTTWRLVPTQLPQEAPAPWVLIDKVTFQPIPEVSLETALNHAGPWRTSTEAPWTGLSQKGAWSGAGTPVSPSWLERDITGPAVIGFRWSGEGLNFSLNGIPSLQLTIQEQTWGRWLMVPAGTHRLRWESPTNRASLQNMFIGTMTTSDLTLSRDGTDFLIRVPRPAGLADNLIYIETTSGPLHSAYWGRTAAAVESSTAEAITFRIPRPGPEYFRSFYRARFGS